MSYIYFIQAQDNGPIKIGFTGDNPRKRMAGIQTSCPWPVKLLGAIEGTISQEKQIHLVLGRFRTQGEWFEPHPIVVAAVNLALECGVPAPENTFSLIDVTSFRALIELWETREAMAADIGAKASAVSKWWQRDSVPAEWWSPVLATDVALKSKIRAETLIEFAARTPETV